MSNITCYKCKRNLKENCHDDLYGPLMCYGCNKWVCDYCRVFHAELCIDCAKEEEEEELIREYETCLPIA
jgi:hypothetical protein